MNKKILLIEDDGIIALDLILSLKQSGYAVIGPIKNLKDISVQINESAPDAIICDLEINNNRIPSAAIFDALKSNNKPKIFLCSYDISALINLSFFENCSFIKKPFTTEVVSRLLGLLLIEDSYK